MHSLVQIDSKIKEICDKINGESNHSVMEGLYIHGTAFLSIFMYINEVAGPELNSEEEKTASGLISELTQALAAARIELKGNYEKFD